jgi:hypothetical protein
MRRATLWSLAATLSFAQTVAFAQSGALSGVTMRVLDDLSGVDAVVLQLDANPAAAEPDAAADSGAPAADDAARARASRDEPPAEPRAAKRERAELHDTAIDERSEGRLEDRDVEQRAVAAPASP